MNHNWYKSLRFKFFIWYFGSLVFVTAYFFLAIHIFPLRYAAQILAMIFLFLAIAGFFIIHKITNSLTTLARRMRTISSENLIGQVEAIRSDDEIGELAVSFQDLLNRLNESFKREQQFIADVAHELKTPLASLRSSVEVTLTKKRSSAEYQKVLADSLLDINRLSSTLKNVLDLAWSEAENKVLSKKVNLSELTLELKEITTKMSHRKNIDVNGKISQDLFLYGDREKLFRALLNILDNAVGYTSYGGTIQITLKKEYNFAVLRICDSGCGIAEEDMLHIFDRFFRGSKSNKVFGSGLGLAIAKSIIVAHHGSIRATSLIGQGTTFIIRLPLVSS